MGITYCRYRPIHNLFQLLNKRLLIGQKPHFPLLLRNLNVDPRIIVEGLFAVVEKWVDLTDAGGELLDHGGDQLDFGGQD